VDHYLIWSHKNGAWWAGATGFTRHLGEAALFSREEALGLCCQGLLGPQHRFRSLPDLPVRRTDVREFIRTFHERYPNMDILDCE
jgi:hypothetical protein